MRCPGRPVQMTTPKRASLVLALAVLAGSSCSFTETEEGAMTRGDRAWARGDTEEALAEYRLALRQGRDDAEAFGRVAHAYARLRQVDESLDAYREAVRRDSSWAGQAVSDLVRLARDAEERNDRFGVASALEAALELEPGVAVEELALPLARHHARNGEYGKALPFFQSALAEVEPDSAPELLFETAMAHEEIGDCRRALVFFERYREIVSRRSRGEVDWHIGTCSYRLAMDLRRGRDPGPLLVSPDSAEPTLGDSLRLGLLPASTEPPRQVDPGSLSWQERAQQNARALRLLERTIALGEPKNLQALAHFEKGEILSERGECQAALEAFRRVLLEDPAGAGPLVSRAQERIDDIRFGRRPSRSLFPDPDEREPGDRRPVPCPGSRGTEPDTAR